MDYITVTRFTVEERPELLPRPLGPCDGPSRSHAIVDFDRDHEYIQDLERCCNRRKEIARHNLMGMVLNERAPSLPGRRARTPALFHLLANRTGSNQDAEFERQLVSNAALTPARILSRHGEDERLQVLGQWRP